jgi:Protein of unknown function (DUF1761)
VLAPVFGDTYHRSQAADNKEEFLRSKETASAAALWGSSLVGAAIQTYGVAALINATGAVSYKGGAYLGGLVFMAGSAPSVRFSFSFCFVLLLFLLYFFGRGVCLTDVNQSRRSFRKSSRRNVPVTSSLSACLLAFSRRLA